MAQNVKDNKISLEILENFQKLYLQHQHLLGFLGNKLSISLNSPVDEGDLNGSVEVLQVPNLWLEPIKALQVILNSQLIRNLFVHQIFNCKIHPNYVSY